MSRWAANKRIAGESAFDISLGPIDRQPLSFLHRAGDYLVTELANVLSGQTPGRQSDRQITLFDGVGFAIEDFSALRWARRSIATNPRFDLLDLLADSDEPRDLYGMLMRANVD